MPPGGFRAKHPPYPRGWVEPPEVPDQSISRGLGDGHLAPAVATWFGRSWNTVAMDEPVFSKTLQEDMRLTGMHEDRGAARDKNTPAKRVTRLRAKRDCIAAD